MSTSNTGLADTLITHFDRALRTLVPGSVTAARQNPATAACNNQLDARDSKQSAGLMRINHTGEVCAQALYQGQSLTARLPEVRLSMEQAAAEEIDHLHWCEARLEELDSQPSIFNPLWYGMSYGLGALAGLAGDKWSLGFVAETEHQVCEHLNEHLHRLPETDSKSKAILEQMLIDEAKHATMAETAGAADLPRACKKSMRFMAGLMKQIVYRI
ncbi:MAG: demethoxyubiquinone hydroxylase family protein [Gammaproteobacteria bacterium]|mgnify:FL=1|nr:demethoxyubiquinone hydroxylase family protein [Gammaproteobacteria bacterium]|tara:strand:+ start:45723 stop:46367 length:645 start_codon:yes stop_codon:yes gene_type:complete